MSNEIRPMTEEEQFAVQVEQMVASSVRCIVEGCDGSCRTLDDSPADWSHEIARGKIAGFAWTVDVQHGEATLTARERKGLYELSAEQVRALADEYEALPAKLRAAADEIEYRNGIVER